MPDLDHHVELKAMTHDHGATPPTLVGGSACFAALQRKIALLGSTQTTVLICGETGTGKDLFARSIHHHSPRRRKPFVPVNCAALPDHLLENELFGHAKGAYTDASRQESGLIDEAQDGTLFLDEINALGLAAQAKLLRFLQDRAYRPLGCSKYKTADVRIVAATNSDLKEQVKAKLFREDLYHRLNVLSLDIPPLRERGGDIALLADYFVNLYGPRYGRPSLRLSPEAVQKMTAYAWPGNVRELEGVVQRAILLCPGDLIVAQDIELPSPDAPSLFEGENFRQMKAQAIIQFERIYLKDLLARHNGNVTRAAKAAGTERRSLQRLLKKYGLNRDAFLENESALE